MTGHSHIISEASNQGKITIPVRRDTLLILTATLILTAAVVAVIFCPPLWRTWGLDGLAIMAGKMRWWWVAVTTLLTVAIWWAARWGRTGVPTAVLATGGLICLAVLVPAATLLRGDGQFLVTGFTTVGKPHAAPVHAFLADRLVTWLLAAGLGGEGDRPGAVDPVPVFHWIAALSALLYSAAWVVFARRFKPPAGRYLCWVAGIFSGALPILAGLVEFYAPVQALTAVGLVLATGELGKGRYPWWGLGVALLATSVHFSGAVILPAFVLAAVHKFGRRAAWGASAAVVTVGLVGAFILGREHLMAPIGPPAEDGYSLLSPRHALDLLNLAFWSAPVLVAVILPLALRKSLRTESVGDPTGDFLGAAALGGLGFALLFAPELGMARDADLMSLFAVPATLWGLWRIRSLPVTGRPMLPAAAVWVGMLTVGAQVVVQGAPDTAVARYERQLERNFKRSGYGWENLSIHHRRNGDAAAEERALLRAYEAGGNTRFLVHLAYFAAQRGDLVAAERYARAAVQGRPDLPDAHGILGILLTDAGRIEEAIPVLREAVRLGTSNGECFTRLAYHLAQDGLMDEAHDAVQLAVKRGGRLDGKFFCVAGMIAEKRGDFQDAAAYYGRALQMNPPAPWRENAEGGLRRVEQR